VAELMYGVRIPRRDDLVDGTVLVHGNARLNLTAADIAAFVDPPDAALVFGLRALPPDTAIDDGFPVWMATLRRRGDTPDAIVETLQRAFPQLVDHESLVHLLTGVADHARSLGYRKLWLAPQLLKEPLMGPAMKQLAERAGVAFELVPTSGMMAFPL
jgi:hypothetical protein